MKGSVKDAVRAFGPLHRTINRMRGNRIHEPARALPGAVRIGSAYGGWCVDPVRLAPDSIVYTVGVGEDISFDLGLIERVGCEVHAFDPTPLAVRWIAGQRLPTKFHFHEIGLGAEDGETEFQLPAVQGYASYSFTANSDAAVKGSIACPIRRLSTIMRDLGHDRIDLLKMDIEGFEYGVVDDMIASKLQPKQLLIEFHHGMYSHARADTDHAVEKLQRYGYELVWVSNVGHEYGFVIKEGSTQV